MIYGPRRIRQTGVSLSVTTAVRFSGDVAGINLTGAAIPTDAVVQVDGITQATSVRNSSSSMTFTLGKAHTRSRGSKAVRWYSPGSGTSSLPATFTVTELLTAEYDNATAVLGGAGGVVVQSQLDISGNGFTRVASTGSVTQVANIMNGRPALTAASTSHSLRSQALGAQLANKAGITVIRAIKSTVASQAGRGVHAIYLQDAGGASFFFVDGYSSLLATSKWTVGANASNARRGSTLFNWTAGEMWIDSFASRNGGAQVLKKNNTAVTLDLANGGTGPLGPNSTTLTLASAYCEFYFSMDVGTQYIGWEMFKDSDLTVAQVGEAVAYLGGIFGVTVAP